jgi:hypothetical protein
MLFIFLQKATISQLLVTSLQAKVQTFKSQQRQRIFLDPHVSAVHVPTKPPIQWILGISTGTKQSKNEAPPTAELMTMWSYTSTTKRHFQRAGVN